MGNENMANDTIIDLQFFINSQRNLGTEIILNMDVNETANWKISTIIKLCRICKLCDPIAMKHGTATEPNTYSRGSSRIDFILCTKALLPFISYIGILPFGMFAFSDHRGLFIDINLYQFLRNPNIDLVINYLWTLISSHPTRVLEYNKELKVFITNNMYKQKLKKRIN